MNFYKLPCKVFGTVLIVLLAIGNVFAQTNVSAVTLTEEEQAWIIEHPVLIASNRFYQAPTDFFQEGKPTGFGVDYLNLIASKVRLKIEYESDPEWSKLYQRFKNKEIDIIHSVVENEERLKFIDFSKSYLDVPIAYYGRVGADKIGDETDLKDKKNRRHTRWCYL